jgi:hypothetical protein
MKGGKTHYKKKEKGIPRTPLLSYMDKQFHFYTSTIEPLHATSPQKKVLNETRLALCSNNIDIKPKADKDKYFSNIQPAVESFFHLTKT